MNVLHNKFIIPICNQDEWDKTLLILSSYSLCLSTNFKELTSDSPYIRYDSKNHKHLLCGSTSAGLILNKEDHVLIPFKELLERY